MDSPDQIIQWHQTVGQWEQLGENMANINQMIESKYLKQTDVDDEILVTIQKVGRNNIAKEGDEPEYKWMVRFAELQKPMVLNSTNIKRLARACNSQESDDWIGKKVILYVDPDVEFGGNVVGGLRIRAAPHPITKKAAVVPGAEGVDGVEEDIPF